MNSCLHESEINKHTATQMHILILDNTHLFKINFQVLLQRSFMYEKQL